MEQLKLIPTHAGDGKSGCKAHHQYSSSQLLDSAFLLRRIFEEPLKEIGLAGQTSSEKWRYFNSR